MTVAHATAVRAKIVDFTAPVLLLELGYLVPAGSPVASFTGVDRPGVRVGVSQGSSSQGVSTRDIDAYATNKAILFKMSDQLPGSRVLAGHWGFEHMAIAIPKGREAAMPFLRKFAADAVADGLFLRAGERAGLPGAARSEAH